MNDMHSPQSSPVSRIEEPLHELADDVKTKAAKQNSRVMQAIDNTPLGEILRGIKAQRSPRYLKLDFFTLLWLFWIACFLGLVLEDIFHFIVYGGFENRAGFLWGPFSSIYGVGAVILTLSLNRLSQSHGIVIFLISMILGSAVEFGASCMMEYFWGAVAWDYSGTLGSIGGRTNLFFGIMWGTLGFAWVRVVMPLIKDLRQRVDAKSKIADFLTKAMTVFLIADIAATCLALNRQSERQAGEPPSSVIEVALDTYYPDEVMDDIFHNMDVYGKDEKDAARPEDATLQLDNLKKAS